VARSQAGSLEIRLLGPFDVRLQGKPLPSLRTRKGQWLLALLVLKQDRPLDRGWLAGTLWPDSNDEQARMSLRKSLNDLRLALSAEAYRIYAPTPRSLGFDLSNAFVDVVRFDAALARGEEQDLQEAVSLYGGPLVENCQEEWVLSERQMREQAYLQALERLAALAMERGDPAGAAERLRLCIVVDPLRESAQRLLMQALAATGSYAAATEVYRDLRLLLRRELNIEPDAETRALYQRLEAQEPPALTAALKTASAASPASPVPSHLPNPLSELIGRLDEMAAVQALLARARLLTLTGTGGVGKTRLAIEVARETQADYADGAWFVDLAGLTDPAYVPQAVATVLGIREETARPLLDTLAETLRDKSLLLVLDNCEHLREACALLAQRLLDRGEGLRILATSRRALGVTGESVWRVPSLAAPEVELLPTGKEIVPWLLGYDAVRLFVNRAHLSLPVFRLTAQNAGAVAQICRRLDGIPLAIELAAARIKVLSAEQIAGRLNDRFRLLTGGSLTALPRQQTLRALIDWSYDLLAEPEKALLRRLSVFAGAWTLEAAEAVCGAGGVGGWASGVGEKTSAPPSAQATEDRQQREAGTPDAQRVTPNADDVLDLLASLLDQSLVTLEAEVEAERRYRMLETIRQYGHEQLCQAGERETFHRRHRDWFRQMAEEAADHLQGADECVWFARLEADLDNVRAALEWCKAETQPPMDSTGELVGAEAGLRIAAPIWRFWNGRGYAREGRKWLEWALAASPDHADEWRARARNAAGILAWFQGDYAAARVHLQAGLEVWRQSGDQEGIAHALNNLGLVAWTQGDLEAAHALHEECLALRREIDDRKGIASSLINLGQITIDREAYDAAWALLEESLRLHEELGSLWGTASCRHSLGTIAYLRGDLAQAHALCSQSMDISREVGHKAGIALALNTLADIARQRGEYGKAKTLLAERLLIRQEMANRPGEIDALESFAALAAAQRQPKRAALLWGAAEGLRQALQIAIVSQAVHADYARYRETMRSLAGCDLFDAAWEDGRRLTLEQAVALALEEKEPQASWRDNALPRS